MRLGKVHEQVVWNLRKCRVLYYITQSPDHSPPDWYRGTASCSLWPLAQWTECVKFSGRRKGEWLQKNENTKVKQKIVKEKYNKKLKTESYNIGNGNIQIFERYML